MTRALWTYLVVISMILGTHQYLKAQGISFAPEDRSNEEWSCIFAEGIWYDPVSGDTLSLGVWPKCEGHSSLCESDFTYTNNPNLSQAQGRLGVWDITETLDGEPSGCLPKGHHLCWLKADLSLLVVECTGQAPREYHRFL